MAVGAGFSETHFRKIYSFLSAYAHSNRLSIIQMQQISTISEQRQFSLAFIGIAMTVLGKYAYDYIYLIPGLQQKVDMNSADYKLILQYKQIAEML